MSWKETYQKWNQFAGLETELKEELTALANDEKAAEEAFYKELEFGTGGMRGEIGVGTNRMNVYTVRKASQGFADFIKAEGAEAVAQGIVIAHDSRHYSPEFALEAAKTLASNGIKAYLFDGLRPTPELSFAVRELRAAGGIVITASHNPPEYNGYKVYGNDGGQLPPKEADDLVSYVDQVADELSIELEAEEVLRANGLIVRVGEQLDDAYQEQLKTIRVLPTIQDELTAPLKIVFTPLHGTGLVPVTVGLKNYGFEHVTVVEEQAEPDGAFPTVSSPNPEEHAAFKLAIEYGDRVDADVLLATDPDADRVGVATRDADGEWVVLTGNQTGALLLDYILSQKAAQGTLPKNGFVAKTIVTSELGALIARHYDLHVENTLTGFKFIGEKIKQYNESGEYEYLFGYEESYGYLIGDFCRDKDAVQACLLAAEMTAYHKKEGRTLYEALQAIYEQFGYFEESLRSLTLKGKDGVAQIGRIMDTFREHPPKQVAGEKVVLFEDYDASISHDLVKHQPSPINLPKSNVLKFTLEDGSWFCLRPSGTEPKIKFYFSVTSPDAAETTRKRQMIEDEVMQEVEQIQ
ncbi:MAG TPA: phosphoglucomutase [Exiguobacterium sp.]|uniref:phospho-sugar mutase n=1 Tax=Exiguobacterium sp. TaxID=44751 RepID=UPI000EC2917B|nr:phospho-sugar mutase [Exiguobacterium sp.]HCN58711.1 phosphoglucomutase [Exiguobacterium sp.]